MVVLSVLRGAGQQALRKLQMPLFKMQSQFIPKVGTTLVRHGSNPARLHIVPSRYIWILFKDHLHFYVMMGLIPIGGILLYCNLFIGHAELAEIPEGYEPKPWEYHKHPVSRFMARYIYRDPIEIYEQKVNLVREQMIKKKIREVEKRSFALQSERHDYKGWYYIPVDKHVIRHQQIMRDAAQDNN